MISSHATFKHERQFIITHWSVNTATNIFLQEENTHFSRASWGEKHYSDKIKLERCLELYSVL
jgi:hypothetical protein